MSDTRWGYISNEEWLTKECDRLLSRGKRVKIIHKKASNNIRSDYNTETVSALAVGG
jgi:hypothetical protein